MSGDRYAQCDDTCTVDCGACKGAGHAMTADLTPAQAARLEAIEAAPYAEEAFVSRVANAAHTAACDCGERDVTWSRYWQQIAVAAIDVMRGATDDGAIDRG